MADQAAQGPTFRLSMLIYDSRYRSMTIQVIALFLFMLGFAWLANNAANNLAALGKPLSFGFLWQPSGYDINQKLIAYDSTMTHARAALVGILNTLLIAVLGCIAATFIGVMVGVLRLSKNWIVARLMTVYIETVRNVPVLLWILLTAAILIETMPKIAGFRGKTPENAMSLWDSVAFTNAGVFVPSPVFGAGGMVPVVVFLLSVVGIFVFGRWAKARQERTGDILPTFWIKLAILTLPALVVFFAMGRPITLEYPVMARFRFEGGFVIRNSLIALWLALSIYTGAFIAEAVRAGFRQFPKDNPKRLRLWACARAGPCRW